MKNKNCLLPFLAVLILSLQPLVAGGPEDGQTDAHSSTVSAATKVAIASQLLVSKPTVFDSLIPKSIISVTDWQELQLDDLVNQFCKPETSFGPQGLRWLLIPIDDQAEVVRRQTIIRSLVQDRQLYDDVQNALHAVKESEDAILAYWDHRNEVHKDAGRFYYSLLPMLSKKFDSLLNKNRVTLEGGYWFSLWSALALLQMYCMLDGNDKDQSILDLMTLGRWKEIGQRMFGGSTYQEMKRTWAPWPVYTAPVVDHTAAVRGTGSYPIFTKAEVLNPGAPEGEHLYKYTYDETGRLNFGNCMNILGSGSIVDRFKVAHDPIHRGTHELGATIDNTAGTTFCAAAGSGVGHIMGSVAGVLTASGGLVLKNAIWIGLVKMAVDDLKTRIKAMYALRHSLAELAKFTRALQQLEKVVLASEPLAGVKTTAYLSQVLNKRNWSADYKELHHLLNSYTFNEKNNKLFIASNVLLAHKLMQDVKDELIPAMQAIAEFDAYLSLAKVYKEHEHQSNTLSFAEFVPHDTPYIAIDKLWAPFVGSAVSVANPVRFGADGKPIRMIITGPNGGGKSTYMTALGHAVIMAHSWGIVPGSNPRMTFFNRVCTSFAPKEDKLRGISKFMAQKRHIGRIQQQVQESSAYNKMLVILDEPFDGTTEALMADRIFEFGLTVKQLPYAVICVATHVKKPIELATDGLFSNYHVAIEEKELGEFVRTFNLVEGPAWRWFNDHGYGSRFQNWLDLDMQRRAVDKQKISN